MWQNKGSGQLRYFAFLRKHYLPSWTLNGENKRKNRHKKEFRIKVLSLTFLSQTHLVVDFVKSLLQLPVDSSQLFKVSVGFMDGQQNLVNFIYGFIHGSLKSNTHQYPVLNIGTDHINPHSRGDAQPVCHHVVRQSEQYHVEGSSCLLQEAH